MFNREPLPRSQLPSDTIELARFLIGRWLVRTSIEGVTAGRIVETEAYPVGDSASHAFAGPAKRARAMFLNLGHAYVYLIYGSSYCVNVVSERAEIGAAVLIRALEPLVGIELMTARRGCVRPVDLVRGPGRLTAALAIDLSLDGCDLCAPGPLFLSDGTTGAGVKLSRRIGLTRNAEARLRFYEAGSAFLSGPKYLST
jgi:DNA-3-methyladenine glycosylase